MKLLYLIPITCLVAMLPCLAVVDANDNGMSDIWELKYSAQSADPNIDSDTDGKTNLEESVAGTDPFNDNSVIGILAIQNRASALIVSWQSQLGIQYRVENSLSLGEDNWLAQGNIIVGNGAMMNVAYDSSEVPRKFYRVAILSQRSSLVKQSVQSLTHDTDNDGLSDIIEIDAGLNPFDTTSRIPAPIVHWGPSVGVTWQTQQGKHYQIQRRHTQPEGAWVDVGSPYAGSGDLLTATVSLQDDLASEYQIVVFDMDTDGDGITDWEEQMVGLDPRFSKTDPSGDGDLSALNTRLLAPNVITVESAGAVANITRAEAGGFKIHRSGGLDKLTVHYSVGGTAVGGLDYEILSGTAEIPFGENSVTISIVPLANSSMALSESVVVDLLGSGFYTLGSKTNAQINVIKEVAINVMDHGATGDGVTDDTNAIQAALSALELSLDHNTLYFPSGTYRLNKVTFDRNTGTSLYRILELGANDLGGRDLIVKGEGMAELFSTVSPERAHMLLAHASFRSLQFYDMVWRKDSVPLRERPNVEPNGADGVSIVYKDARIIEKVGFYDCEFLNCHGAMHTYRGTITDNGKLKRVEFHQCKVDNPYGANTVNSVTSWGGGQQCKLSSWVGLAEYIGNQFNGGGDDMTDATTCPGGRLKDGSHFGGPQRLIFRDNIVTRMGVEAVLQNSVNNALGVTQGEFLIPEADGVSTAIVGVSDDIANFKVGQLLNIRTLFTPTSAGSDNIFEVVGTNAVEGQITLKNTGNAINSPAGVLVNSGRSIFLQDENATTALIENNVINGAIPPGGRAFYTQSGIVVIAKSIIRNNLITDFWTGINLYEDTKRPIYPASRGTIVDSNIIVTRNPLDFSQTFTYGIQLMGGDEIAFRNLIMLPVSYKCMGIVAHSENSLIKSNSIGAWQFGYTGRYELDRSIGTATSFKSTGGCRFVNNKTRGFDVGVGRAQWYQDVNYTVDENISYEDKLPVDPLALILNN